MAAEFTAQPHQSFSPKERCYLRFGDVVDVVDYVANGSFESLRNNVSYRSTPDYAVLVRLADFTGGWNGSYVYVDEPAFRFLRKSSVQPGDVIVANVGAPGVVFRAPDLSQPMTLGPNAVLCKPRDASLLDRRFLYYYLRSAPGQHMLQSIVSGSAQPKFNKTDLRNAKLNLPPLAEQRRIAGILGALDDKIELNRRMNETLEAMARAIFKSWFVDFDPVHAKARGEKPFGMNEETAALFPDKFTDSPLGPIPYGWRAGTFGDIARQIRRPAKPQDIHVAEPYIGLEHMPRKSITLSEWGCGGDATSQKARFNKGDILFGKLRPYFHKVGIAPVNGVCSTDIIVINAPCELHYAQAVMTASSDAMIDFVTASSDGTRMPRTKWEDLARFGVAIPDDRLCQAYTTRVMPMLHLIRVNLHEGRSLAALRDLLLPRLLGSGASASWPR